ncbi:indoleamine 2,3-dioxygenase-like protein [Trichocladium antarcticum]|uniref:Indoleamine 2,3-dioxygenase-like protein n=1 Tax=Trichocladium antarcticum TaxID=1450529 RepID=A0AAN6UGT2_9PEZI|nr:indoleamine 2,3-dioxygenase-like protein [Trichocladium antarcticum]
MTKLHTATMGPPFTVLEDTRPDDMSLPAFMVSTTRGFLPRMDPIATLPSEFDALESLLQRMPVKTLSGAPGLLAQGQLGPAATELPDLTDCIDKYRHNLPLMNALYRDYSFLASAYLLEPCHERFVRGEEYGLARDVLPANIARPIAKCAALYVSSPPPVSPPWGTPPFSHHPDRRSCEFKPFMEYAGSYALYNYRLVDPALGLTSANLRLIRAFEHGLDPASSEAGFVLVHIEMVKCSGPLVSGALACLDALSAPRNRAALNTALGTVHTALGAINKTMDTMWARSRPAAYTSFRTFIFGITSQSMFPGGVLYEGVAGHDGKPVSFRGESGANDSMVPLVDNLLAIPMPDTPLTAILDDFRSYRPSNHRAFLGWVKERAAEGGLRAWALGLDGDGEDEGERRASRALWIRVLDQVRDFRWRHWCFAREYILKRTSHPTATGGSPIVTWLPNQLQAVLDEMVYVYGVAGGDLGAECADIMALVARQQATLRKEVRKFCEDRGVAAASA